MFEFALTLRNNDAPVDLEAKNAPLEDSMAKPLVVLLNPGVLVELCAIRTLPSLMTVRRSTEFVRNDNVLAPVE